MQYIYSPNGIYQMTDNFSKALSSAVIFTCLMPSSFGSSYADRIRDPGGEGVDSQSSRKIHLSSAWYEYEGPDTKWGAPGKVCFVPENSKITGDGLVQTAMAPSGGFDCGLQNMPYTTSQIKWSKFNVTYGVVEYRAKFAGGVGTHPAI